MRATAGLTQIQVAVLTGIPISRYIQIEHGIESPNDTERQRLARTLHVEIGQIPSIEGADLAEASR